MEVVEMNGGNAEVARTKSNLEVVAVDSMADDKLGGDKLPIAPKMDDDEVNGDDKTGVKKVDGVKRRMRKSKSNSTSSVEADAKPKVKGVKRKISEPDGINDDDGDEFIGFSPESITIIETGLAILQKLIGEYSLLLGLGL